MACDEFAAHGLDVGIGPTCTTFTFLVPLLREPQVRQRTPTRRGHTNVLQHLAGYISAHLDGDEREELTEMIDQYRLGFLPLIVPVTLIRHYVRKFPVPYLLDQAYLSPHPHELMLLNHL
jgi:uncharacterized protein YbgA (DUF1722 family)